MVELKSVTKKFGEFVAVEDLDLSINTGEVTALLGPNGAGKTTTMRLVTGYLIPDFGEIYINNVRYDGEDIGIKNLIGYMPENNPLYYDLQVQEAFKLHGGLRGIANLAERIDFVVKATGLASVYNRVIGELSKGFKQRVGLAIALLADPSILILDEPTEGLDPNQRGEIRELIKGLAKNKTVIISTHVLSEVEMICDRVVIINSGKIIADGTKESILAASKGSRIFKLAVAAGGVEPKLQKLATVSSVRHISEEDGYHFYEIATSEVRAFLDDLHQVQLKERWKLGLLHEQQSSLEEIFYRLTHNEKA